MSYFTALGLDREPFSTSPDPSFFFLSEEHKAALRRLQIAINLRRGLSVILGDVGTGKTTLSRRLARELSGNPNILFHMVLNPYFETEKEFLTRLASLFHIEIAAGASGLELIEAIEKYLFRRGVEEHLTVVLLIDEAQILPNFVLEILRILLNYETNEYKILQLVLMGQLELLPRISQMSNFWDRIALRYILNPLGEKDVKRVIDFRLEQAGYKETEPLFTDEAIGKIHAYTGGYPRKVALICHNALESLVMYDRKRVDAETIDDLIAADVQPVQEPAEEESGGGAGEPVVVADSRETQRGGVVNTQRRTRTAWRPLLERLSSEGQENLLALANTRRKRGARRGLSEVIG